MSIVQKIEQAKQQVTAACSVVPDSIDMTLPLYMLLLQEVGRDYLKNVSGMTITVLYRPGHVFTMYHSEYRFSRQDEQDWTDRIGEGSISMGLLSGSGNDTRRAELLAFAYMTSVQKAEQAIHQLYLGDTFPIKRYGINVKDGELSDNVDARRLIDLHIDVLNVRHLYNETRSR